MYNNHNKNNNYQVPNMNMSNYRYSPNIPVQTANRNYSNYNSGNISNFSPGDSHEKQTNNNFYNSRPEASPMQQAQHFASNKNQRPAEKMPYNSNRVIYDSMQTNANCTSNIHNNSTYVPPQQSTSAFAMPMLEKKLQGAVLETPSLKRKYFPTPQTSGTPSLNSTTKFDTSFENTRKISKLNESNFESEENAAKRLRTNETDENDRTTSMKSKINSTRVFTGTVEKAIKWNKIYKGYFCFYEIIASLVSIQEGRIKMQRILLVRDKKGPIMQIIYYETDHIHIENFVSGQMLRCVGRMVGPNILHAISIREATDEEVTCLLRMCYICDHAIQRVLTEMSEN